MLNTIYLIVAIVFLILIFIIFREDLEIAFMLSFFGELLVVVIFVMVSKAPWNFESKTNTQLYNKQINNFILPEQRMNLLPF